MKNFELYWIPCVAGLVFLLVILFLGNKALPKAALPAMPSWVILVNGGEPVYTWECREILERDGNSIKFVNHKGRIIICTGSYVVAEKHDDNETDKHEIKKEGAAL